MNYEEDIQIDETALDVEWLDQPSLMMKYSRHAAEMRKRVDLAKEKLEYVKAKIDKDIRTNPDKFGIDKVTEGAIFSAIQSTETFKEASTKVIETKFELDIAQAAVIAISQRKDALENLVRLYGQQYFAGPKIPRDINSERQKSDRQKRINQSIGGSMSRSK